MVAMEKVLYTAKTHAVGGREGTAKSSDGRLDVKFSPPGGSGTGTNPEQLFAAGWSACFMGAMGVVVKAKKLTLPATTSVDAEVDLGQGGGGYMVRARLKVSIPGVDPATAQAIVDEAHQICPYSKATRGNIEVQVSLA